MRTRFNSEGINTMKEIKRQNFSGERALFATDGAVITECIFADGESPLKESRNIELYCDLFRWKYPLWYCNNVRMENCTLFDTARAGIWYTSALDVKNTVIEAKKTFRRCDGVVLENVTMTDAGETLWDCRNVEMKNVSAKGDYFAMNAENYAVDGLTLVGNYSFDGAKNVTVRNSKLMSKDAFWNSENVTVYDSFISGEYLGWNSRNLTLINCTVESLQGLCYIENLVMRSCRLINTTLAFEYADADAEVTGKIDSVFNPSSGKISADRIDTLIIQPERTDPEKTEIVCDDIGERLSRPEWEPGD